MVHEHYPQNFAETDGLQAEIPVLVEVKGYLLLGAPQNISANQRLNESEVAPLPRNPGGGGGRSLG